MRTQTIRVLAAALVLMVVASGNDVWSAPAMGSEQRHSSGIAMLGPVDQPRLFAQWRLSDRLERAYNSARILAEQNPSAFGYPWQDSGADEVIVSVANAEGEALARRWIAEGVQQSFLKSGGPVVMELPPPEVGVRLRTVNRSVEYLERIKDAVGPGLASLPGSERIFQSEPDYEHNRVIFTTDRVDDALLSALAARFGTEALAVRIEKRPRWTGYSDPPNSPLDTSAQVSPFVVALIGAAIALVIGLLILGSRQRVNR